MNPFDGGGLAPVVSPSWRAPEPPKLRHSLVGIVSLSLAGLGALGMFGTFGIAALAGVLEESGTVLIADDSPAEVVVGLGIIGFVAMQLMALALSVVGLFEKDRKRICALVAAVISGVTLAAGALLLAIGLLVA